MSAKGNAPIIIKKKKVVAGDGHHGGAWKVAYADFVTAMMAFFLLMWLLNATTEKQRKGIADYFNPTIPINRVSGGGNGAFGGDSVFTEETLAHNGTGASSSQAPTPGSSSESNEQGEAQGHTADLENFAEIQQKMVAFSGESNASNNAMRHIVTRVTDEGLIIELFDTPEEALFQDGTATPTAVTRSLLDMIARVSTLVVNEIATTGYVKSQPLVVANNPVWDLSSQRADAMRVLLEQSGIPPNRIQRITGFADRKPFARNTLAVRNNRVEIILLRTNAQRN